MSNTAEQQKIVRELSPQYLAEHPPIGIVASLAAIWKKVKAPDFRKPFVRKPDEDETYWCYECKGDGDYWCSEDQEWVDCPHCDGNGDLHFNENQTVLTVYRDGHSIETVATLMPTGAVIAFVNVTQPGFPEGVMMELTQEESDLALRAIRGGITNAR